MGNLRRVRRLVFGRQTHIYAKIEKLNTLTGLVFLPCQGSQEAKIKLKKYERDVFKYKQ